MKQKSKKLRMALQAKAKKKRDLKIMVDSFMRSLTCAPSFDLRCQDAPRHDRSRSNGSGKLLHAGSQA
jgi:hypothetical protein